MKSALERFNSIMNGEDLDAEAPSIDVEINVIQKEIEAEDMADDINTASNDIDDTVDTAEQVEEAVDEAEMLVKILKEDGINPLALKILSTNKVYTNVWNIALPSTESLDTTGNNRRQAEQIATALEASIAGAKKGLSDAWEKVKKILENLWVKFTDKAKANDRKVDELDKQLTHNKNALDEKKSKDKKVKLMSLEAVKTLLDGLEDLSIPAQGIGGAGATKENAIEKYKEAGKKVDSILQAKGSDSSKAQEVALATVIDNINKYHEYAKKAYSVKKKLDDHKKEILTAMKNVNSKGEEKGAIVGNLAMPYTRYVLKKAVGVLMTIQQQYIKAASAILGSKVKTKDNSDFKALD